MTFELNRTNQKPREAPQSKIIIIMMFCITFFILTLQTTTALGTEKLYEQATSGTDASSLGSVVTWRSQTFTIGTVGSDNAFNVRGIELESARTGDCGTVTFSIRAVDGTNKPTGADLASGSRDCTDFSDSGTEFTRINMTVPVTLAKGTMYAVVWRASSTQFEYDQNNAGGYGGGANYISVDSGASWAIDGSVDANFKVFGSDDFFDSEVNLTSPIDSAGVIETDLFNTSAGLEVVGFSMNISNATLFIWNSTNDLINRTTVDVGSVITNATFVNYTTFNVPVLDLDTYTWNTEYCFVNNTGSGTICEFAPSNASFVYGYTIDTQTFNANAFETDNELFEFNITTVAGLVSVSSLLNYNGTIQTATSTCDGTECSLSASVDINLVGGSSELKDFFFEVSLFGPSSSIVSNLSSGTQNVSQIFFDVCSPTLTVPVVNFTVFDEQSNDRISPFYIAGEFDFWLGDGNLRRTISFSNSSTDSLAMCISPPDRDFFIEDTIEYNDEINSSVYNTRNYFFQLDTLNNITRDIPLFLLSSDDSTSFILKVQDTNLLPVDNALIFVQRLNVGTGNFTTVQIAKTDDNGQTVGFFKTETVDYRFIIVKNGVTLLTTSQGKVVPETAPFTLTFTVGADEDAPWKKFEDLGDLTDSLIFNSTTATVSYIYADTSGNFSSARLLVTLGNLSGIDQTICDVTSSSPSAVLSCDTGNVSGTYTASAFITRDEGTFLVEQIIFKIQTFADTVGLLGVFLAWFIILISSFAFKFNEIAGIVLMNIAVIAVNIIGLVNFGFLFIFGMMGVSIIIIVLLER